MARKKAPNQEAYLPKYKTSAQFTQGLNELRSKALEWAHELADARDTKGTGAAMNMLSVASDQLIKQAEIDTLRETERANRAGYQIHFLDEGEQPEAKA